MNILIVSATYLEIEPLLTHFHFVHQPNQKLRQYHFKNHEIDVLIPGVGMTFTAYWLGKTLAQKRYDYALNLGIAGSFTDDLSIGEVVHIVSDRISELGAEDGEKFLSLIDMDLLEDEDFTLQNGEMTNTISIKNDSINKLKKVKGITVNTTHGEDNSIKKAMKLFHPDVESMEGAAFLYACLLEGISCVQIRAISNKIEKRKRENWNIKLAIKNLTKTSLEILQTL